MVEMAVGSRALSPFWLPYVLLVACATPRSEPAPAPAPVLVEAKPAPPATVARATESAPEVPSDCKFTADDESASIICMGDQPVHVNLVVLAKLGPIDSLDLVNVKLHDLMALPELEVQQFGIQGPGVADLSGIERLKGLKTFGVYAPVAPTLGALEKTGIDDLTLTVDATTDVRPLTRMKALETLSLSVNAERTPNLAGLTQIKKLTIHAESLTSLETIAALDQLEELEVESSALADLGPLAGLTSLRILSANAPKASDLKPLAKLTRLESVHLANMQLTDLSPLHKLFALRALSLSNSPVPKAKLAAFKKAQPDCVVH
jgi:Leucine-rich repeat (LRR) protein